MNEAKFPQLFWGIIALSLSLLFSTFMGTQALKQFKNSDNTISVTGSARKGIRSDFATWRSSITYEATSREEAYQIIQAQTETVQNYFIDQGIPSEAITLDELNLNSLPEYLANGNQSGRIRGFKLMQHFEVRLADVNKIANLARQSMSLLNQGLAFESYPPEYLYTKLSDLRVEMLAQATEDARERAQHILTATDNKLGPVRSVRTGVFQITRPHSTEVSDYGRYDTSSIDKDITAVLTLSFAVE